MRVEAASARVEARREPDAGFERALRVKLREALSPPEGRAESSETANPVASPAPAAPPSTTATGATSAGAGATCGEPAARAAVALRILRHAERAEMEIAAGEGLRYALAQTSLGVEIRVRASAGLERAARAQLHAVVAALSRRGVRLARAEVLRALRGRGAGSETRR